MARRVISVVCIVAVLLTLLFHLCGSAKNEPGASHSAFLMLKAAESGDTDTVIDLIINKGVVMNTKNNYGVSAIIFAANNGHLELLRALVEIGADIEDRTNNWRTPLIWSSLWGHHEIVEYLVDVAGANISASDVEGMTPLMSAVKNGHIRIVQYLLQRGANPTTKNYYNGTALSIAKVRNDEQLLHLLEPYFPDKQQSNDPYVIAVQLIARELTTLLNVFVEESIKFYSEVGVWYSVLTAEWHRYSQRWQAAVKKRAQLQNNSSNSNTRESNLDRIPDSDALSSAAGSEDGSGKNRDEHQPNECVDDEFKTQEL